MVNVHFISDYGPYKAGMYSQFKEDTARELAEQSIVEILDAPGVEPVADVSVDNDSSKPRRSK